MGSDFFDALGQVINPNFCITMRSSSAKTEINGMC